MRLIKRKPFNEVKVDEKIIFPQQFSRTLYTRIHAPIGDETRTLSFEDDRGQIDYAYVKPNSITIVEVWEDE